MECTQKLECTQELYEDRTEKTCPEQIGFLGICGSKYPVKKGPNKIGRDPHTCNIVLNLNSISRQHAVINILNQREFMLMDLDSANKTKILDKTLQPYIPHRLKNGDTVQFGEIFGIFRLLEEDDDLPMTQAIDIPETPVIGRHISKLNKIPITTIPESPDVSDKDDSFIASSQPKGNKKQLHNVSNHHFIKPGKTISIQPIGTNKIDNIYWNSSKKSKSLNLDDSSGSLNSSVKSVKNDDIHEMNTQLPSEHDGNTDFIYTANTQIQKLSNASPSIHTANTQLPEESHGSNIHSLETQLPPITEHLPEIRKINKQQDMQFDLYAANKENDKSIFNADTQEFVNDKEQSVNNNEISISKRFNEQAKLNASDEELLFDEVDNQPLEDDFASQAILPEDTFPIHKVTPISEKQTEVDEENLKPKPSKRVMRVQSDNSTDCEDIDILPTQKIPEIVDKDEDITDCEDDFIEIKKSDVNKTKTYAPPKIGIGIEDMATQVIRYDNEAACKTDMDKVNLEDMATQVIELEIENHVPNNNKMTQNELDFEDLPTQVIDEDIPNNPERVESEPFSEELVSPFKIPLQAVFKHKRKDISRPAGKPKHAETKSSIDLEVEDKYYNETQEIFDDLCSQREHSPEVSIRKKSSNVNNKSIPSSEDDKAHVKLSHVENHLSPKKFVLADKSSSSSEGDEKINRFVRNLSKQQVRDVIGVDLQVAQLKKVPSDGSDVEVTPKKIRPFKFIDTDLPNSQEIKTSVSLSCKSLVTESSSESEVENNSEDQCTPILFRKKKKPKPDAKVNLAKKLDVELLPTRVITRIRKPTAKINDENSKNLSKNILKPKFLTEQEDEIDKEIISENISRLKTKNEKFKSNKNSDNTNSFNDDKNNHTSQNTSKGSEQTEVKKERKSRKKISKKESENVNKSREKTKDTNKNKKTELKDDITKEQVKNELSKSKEMKESIDLTVEPKQRSRSTRSSRNKEKSVTIQKEKKSQSPVEDYEKNSDNKRKRTYNKRVKKDPSPEKETEVRRSKRQKIAKNKEETKVTPKSILKNSTTLTHEQSTVYNISTGSSNDSPMSLKRSAVDESIVPSSKRTRSVAVSSNTSRSTPANTLKTHHVLFTAFPYEEVRVKLQKLGAVIETDVTACSVVLTLQIKRTFKLLCAVGLGRPIVGPNWVQACADTNMIVDPWLYLIEDKETEKRFNFSLRQTLTGKRNFLKGYNVSSTPSVMPNASEMKLIVECSGGRWKEEGARWICVSSTADKALWSALRRKGATIVSTEFILGGVLRQKLDIEANMFK